MEKNVEIGFVRVISIYLVLLVMYGIVMLYNGDLYQYPNIENMFIYLGLFLASIGIESFIFNR